MILLKKRFTTQLLNQFKSDVFEGWGFPKTEFEITNLLKELRQKIKKCCKSKEKCNSCIEIKRKSKIMKQYS